MVNIFNWSDDKKRIANYISMTIQAGGRILNKMSNTIEVQGISHFVVLGQMVYR